MRKSESEKAFITQLGTPGFEVHLTRCRELGSDDDALSIAVTSYDGAHQLYITDCRPQFIDIAGDSGLVNIQNCDYVDCDVTFRSKKVRISDSQFDYLAFNTNDMKMSNCTGRRLFLSNDDLTILDSEDPYYDATPRYDEFTARGCHFNGDLSANSTCIFYPVLTTRKWRAAFYDCTFYNSARIDKHVRVHRK